MIDQDIQDLEIEFLLKVLDKLYGINFLDYRKAFIKRRILRRVQLDNYNSITDLTSKVLENSKIAITIINDITISVSEMFRSTSFYKALLTEVFPILQTYPIVRIWHAGCSNGEEILSLAILLKEANLYDKCEIIASDISSSALNKAKHAAYPIEKIKEWTYNYFEAGGNESFSKYYNVKDQTAYFDQSLLANISFHHHNLIKDEFFQNQHLILCRNVFIYFNQDLQKRIAKNFFYSLTNKGFLGVGSKETILDNPLAVFEVFNLKNRIYRKSIDG